MEGEGKKGFLYMDITNIYIENVLCFVIIRKSVNCYELYSNHSFINSKALIGKYKSFEEAEQEVDRRTGKIKKKRH